MKKKKLKELLREARADLSEEQRNHEITKESLQAIKARIARLMSHKDLVTLTDPRVGVIEGLEYLKPVPFGSYAFVTDKIDNKEVIVEKLAVQIATGLIKSGYAQIIEKYSDIGRSVAVKLYVVPWEQMSTFPKEDTDA